MGTEGGTPGISSDIQFKPHRRDIITLADILTEDGLLIENLELIKGKGTIRTKPKVNAMLFREIIQQYKVYMIEKYGTMEEY